MKQSILLMLLVFLLSNCTNKTETCKLSGKIIGRSSDTLILMNALDDPRFATIRIPIIDSTFSFDLKVNPTQAYWLVFQDEFQSGGFRPITIFPDDYQINLTLYPAEQFEKNKIIGGKHNEEYTEFTKLRGSLFDIRYKQLNDSIQALYNKGQYESDSLKLLYERLRKSRSADTNIVIYREINGIRARGNDLTNRGKQINQKVKAISKEQYSWMLDYFEDNPTIVSYFLFIQNCLMQPDENSDIERIKQVQNIFAEKLKEHPYYNIAEDLINSATSIKIGGKYVDFSVPDLNGKLFTLSDLINNKIALIDLWATWCGPCIAEARSMVPVYQEFKDNGFIIVGVAAEIKNTDRLKIALEREKFPWLNLVELDHQNNIWHKYGISNSGGKTFLVDKNGEIIAISPSSDEVRKILEEKLQ